MTLHRAARGRSYAARGRSYFVRGAGAALLLALIPAAGHTAGTFPFDQELLLNVSHIGTVKRVPMLTVEANGDAIIDLWCKSVTGHVAVSDDSIKITADALPESLPDMMSSGQCSPERMQADQETLASLLQVTAWRHRGDTLELSGPQTLRFFSAAN
jgi:heat shock protein HslJ